MIENACLSNNIELIVIRILNIIRLIVISVVYFVCICGGVKLKLHSSHHLVGACVEVDEVLNIKFC